MSEGRRLVKRRRVRDSTEIGGKLPWSFLSGRISFRDGECQERRSKAGAPKDRRHGGNAGRVIAGAKAPRSGRRLFTLDSPKTIARLPTLDLIDDSEDVIPKEESFGASCARLNSLAFLTGYRANPD